MDENNTTQKYSGDLPYDVYVDERKLLIDAEREGARSFDKYILTLAAGALGLSLTFIRIIAPTASQKTVWYLFWAWGLFCLSILSTLVSFLTSQRACRIAVKILEGKKKNNHMAKVTLFLNIVSIIFFVGGTILLLIFSSKNLLN